MSRSSGRRALRRPDDTCTRPVTRVGAGAVCSGMSPPDAVVTAVLRTLIRATVDARVVVVLRSHRPAQAHALACWLSAVHGSRRVVVASTTARAAVSVRLPARMAWPAGPDVGAGLARGAAGHHLSPMTSHDPDGGSR